MKLNLILVRSILLVVVSGLLSFSAAAQKVFSLQADSYTSVRFATLADVDRLLFYRSAAGSEFVVAENSRGTYPAELNRSGENPFLEREALKDAGDFYSAITLLAEKSSSVKSLSPVSLFTLYQQRPLGRVLVQHEGGVYLLYGERTAIQSVVPIAQSIRGTFHYTYRIEHYVPADSSAAYGGENQLFLELELNSNTVLSFDYNAQNYVLQRIEDQAVRDVVAMVTKYPTIPTAFDFKGDALRTRYQWKKSASAIKTLEVEYKTTGKKNNLIQVKTTAETQVYDPKTPSSRIEKHIGVLALTQSGELLELKKVQKSNGRVNDNWEFDYKKRLIKVGEQLLFVEKENYYGFEGLWYLAYWMVDNPGPEQKIYLINGQEPIALTARYESGKVEISRAGKVLYRFILNGAGFVTMLQFIPMQQTLELVNRETDTTARNRQKIIRFMQSRGVISL